MNNINWNEAPAWANYYAKDADGRWFWHEFEPFLEPGARGWYNRGRMQACESGLDWRESVTKREAINESLMTDKAWSVS